jgi:hypothetical protein
LMSRSWDWTQNEIQRDRHFRVTCS